MRCRSLGLGVLGLTAVAAFLLIRLVVSAAAIPAWGPATGHGWTRHYRAACRLHQILCQKGVLRCGEREGTYLSSLLVQQPGLPLC